MRKDVRMLLALDASGRLETSQGRSGRGRKEGRKWSVDVRKERGRELRSKDLRTWTEK